jgi:VWFA-related protein
MTSPLRLAVWTGCLVAFLVPGAAAQQQPGATAPTPTFRAGTRLVVHTISVKDKQGNPIEGLTAGDFIVTEDGERQSIAFLEFQRLHGTASGSTPGTASQAPAAPPANENANLALSSVVQSEIAKPPPGDTRFKDRRLIIVYFDLTATPPNDQARAYQAALKYIGSQMEPADLVAIMTFGGGAVRVKQDFTGDRARLRAVVETLFYGEDKDGDGIPDPPDAGTAFGQDDAEFNIFNTDRQLSALQTAVAMLRPLPEQKSLVYFASGLRLNGTDNQAQLRATTNAAIRANVQIFPVDARGLVASAPLGDATRPSPGGIGMFSGRLAEAATTRFQRSQDTLYALAKDTGGAAMFDFNDLSMGIVRAAQAQTSYYVIGYYSTHTAADGRFRRVRVSLARELPADLTYREGYYGDKEFARLTGVERERQLEEALMLENPITDITIALEVNYFQLNRAEYFVPVAVKIPGSELALARRRGAQRTLIDFIGEIKDEYGITISNVRDRIDIKLTDETASQLARRPIQYETGFTLLPGKYVIKLLARDAEAGRIGTYQTAFTVPNLNREEKRLPTSSVVLGSQRVPLGEELHNVKNTSLEVNPLVMDGEKLVPSVTRVFSTSRDLFVYLQAYERQATATQPLVAFVTFYRGDVKAFETEPVAITGGLNLQSKAVPVRLSVPLSGLPAGPYQCQVTVLEPTGRKVAFWQAPIVLVP